MSDLFLQLLNEILKSQYANNIFVAIAIVVVVYTIIVGYFISLYFSKIKYQRQANENARLTNENKELTEKNGELTVQVASLKEDMKKYKHIKNIEIYKNRSAEEVDDAFNKFITD